MKKYISKDKAKRKLLGGSHLRITDHLLVNFKSIPLREKAKVAKKEKPSWKTHSSSKSKNRCLYGFRSRSVLGSLGIGRHFFLKKVSNGLIPGYTKFSK